MGGEEEQAPAEEVMELEPEAAAELAQYDLTPKMAPFLDTHLIFKLLQFLMGVGMYKKKDIIRAEIGLLMDTKMLDFAADMYAEIGEDPPEELASRRAEVSATLMEERESMLSLLQILEDPDQIKRIKNAKSIGELWNLWDQDPDSLDRLVHLAKSMYDCGQYNPCSEILKHCREIRAVEETKPDGKPMTAEHLKATWGALASLTLEEQSVEDAADMIDLLDDHLDKCETNKREVLLQRSWLLHWTLFSIFRNQRDDQVKHKLVDFFLNEKSLSIISLSCPHLFRYVGACLILSKRLKNLNIMKDTVWIVHHEAGSYSDPITRFLLALYTDMDFDEAQRELQQCAVVCKADYFLEPHWAEFEENARLLIFETYCRIHQCININMIASKLNMEAEEAELWIVKLIQHAKLDARIDSEKSRVVMSKAPPSVYQQVIEKTKNLSRRSTMLLSNLDKREKERAVDTR